jgi:hypothetical protein
LDNRLRSREKATFELDLKLDGEWIKSKAGDLVQMPRGVPHGYLNKSDRPSRAVLGVTSRETEGLVQRLARSIRHSGGVADFSSWRTEL